jgi:acyl-CoA thioesterase FadM
MPFAAAFPIRYHDLDPYGHLKTPTYLRFMLETDMAAQQAAGLALPGVNQATPVLSPRQVFMEFRQPLYWGDQAQVTGSTQAVQGERLLRAYSIQKDGIESSNGRIEWVLQQGGSRVPIGEALAQRLQEAEAQASGASEPLAFPLAPAPPPGVVSRTWRVRWSDAGLDYALSPAALVEYLIETGIYAGAQFGWTVQTSQELGFGVVAFRLWLEQLQPAPFLAELRIDSYLSDPGRSSIVRHFLVYNPTGQEAIARGRILWVFVDLKGGRPLRVPASYLEMFREHIAAGESG